MREQGLWRCLFLLSLSPSLPPSLPLCLLVFPQRSTRSHRVCLSYSGHRISAQTDDVHYHIAAGVLHSLGVWRRDNPHADVASDQVSGTAELLKSWGSVAALFQFWCRWLGPKYNGRFGHYISLGKSWLSVTGETMTYHQLNWLFKES